MDIKIDQQSFINIDRGGNSTLSELSELVEISLYDGAASPLIYQREFVLSLQCQFDLYYYPFDTQICPIRLKIPKNVEGYVDIVPGEVGTSYSGDLELTQFRVLTWNMTKV